MIASQQPRRPATTPRGLLLVASCVIALAAGCEPGEPAAEQSFPRPPETEEILSADDESPPERSSVELPAATAVLEDGGIVRFDIEYRFKSGHPRGFYLFNMAFPGTENNGVKPMDASELKTEGTVTTRIEVGDAPVDAYEITMSEADSPDQGYFLISETLTGNVQRPETVATEAASPSESDTQPKPPAKG